MEHIVEGLKMALAKGHSIEAAATSFKNAGYHPKDVDAAVREVQTPNFQPRQTPPPKHNAPTPTKETPTPKRPSFIERIFSSKKKSPIVETSPDESKKESTPKNLESQEVSKYGEKPKPKKKILWIILGIAILVLIGIVVTGFIFKTEIANFFARLFP